MARIHPLLDRVAYLSQVGLSRFGIVRSFLHRRVQPLQAREHLGFEYISLEDPSRMVPALELTDEEVLARLRQLLKGATVVPPRVEEYDHAHPPPTVNCSVHCGVSLWRLTMIFLSCVSLLALFFHQGFGRNFVDPLPTVSVVDPLAPPAEASSSCKSPASVFIPGFSIGDLDLQYVEYVPRPIPRGHRSMGKRGADAPAASEKTKKSRSSSPVITGSMLLGERVLSLMSSFLPEFFPNSSPCCSDQRVVILEPEEDMESSPFLLIGECFLVVLSPAFLPSCYGGFLLTPFLVGVDPMQRG